MLFGRRLQLARQCQFSTAQRTTKDNEREEKQSYLRSLPRAPTSNTLQPQLKYIHCLQSTHNHNTSHHNSYTTSLSSPWETVYLATTRRRGIEPSIEGNARTLRIRNANSFCLAQENQVSPHSSVVVQFVTHTHTHTFRIATH